MFKDVFKNFKSHCMTGISYMIPVIVIGGFCTAIARLCGNVDVQGTLGYAFISAGNAAFGLMMSVLCAGIAYSICGKPGIAPGVVAGYLSTQVKSFILRCFNLWILDWYDGSLDARKIPRFKSFEINVSNRYLSSIIRNCFYIVDYVCLWTTFSSFNSNYC